MLFELQREDRIFLQSDHINTIVVGLSGGVDSVVLLHSVVHLGLPKKIIAVHVHHGLSANADDWLAHCKRLCDTMAVDFYSHKVVLDSAKGSLEEKARDARYEIFERYIGVNDVLLLGHHRGDQAETLLFRLLRGTGGRGLAGIPHRRRLGKGSLLRPLMHLPKQTLYEYAAQFQLAWVEDESNRDVRFQRNKIRQELLPTLKTIAPKIEEQLSNTAARIQVDYSILDRLARRVMSANINEWGGLILADLPNQPVAEQIYWLQSYLREHAINATYAQLENVAFSVSSDTDHQPLIVLSGKRLQRLKGVLYVLPKDEPSVPLLLESGVTVNRAFDQVMVQGEGTLELKLRPSQLSLLMPSGQHRLLKKWFNDQQIPVWWRDHLPYVFQNDVLVAIGDLWQNPQYPELHIEWIINKNLVLPKPSKVNPNNHSWIIE
ncbi:tRNA lysidine(34) synthetase TilS [Marinomonas algicola]|uniref:tRNA lysidine(34) synthetase TilS n=1 Tax=Marinomonas algicola TaxID=2773454 RepID=UPI00174C2FA1|nr:tRNA lysidine(34) synthetase TilS [Marinomonas algicola]